VAVWLRAVEGESAVENTPPSEDGEALGKTGANSFHPARSWFAVYTICRHEKRVARHLEQRQIEHFLPIYRTEHNWRDGSRVTLELPLFPGYVLVRIPTTERVSVLEVPGVISMIGSASHPAPLPDLEVEALRAGLDPTRAEPHPLLTVGQRVRVKTGALAGIEGIVVRKKGGLRLVLTLDLLMQSIAIEVNGDDVEPVDALSPLTLEITDKEMDRSQRIPLYEF
jgi:transcription antitermination factor NusG